ncbi:methyltransferase domain-containing protein [Candidatus Halobeggiatoa sp. HSG11]|nr:methyltransferase domain-containing protein [Candidatus Halobeggiatoa sp. HSG11]
MKKNNSTFLKSLYGSYAFGMKILGFERSISNFILSLNLEYPSDSKILDVGCGTGIIGLTLMNERPNSTLIATDLNSDLLLRTKQNAKKMGIEESRITLGMSDISQPNKAKSITNPSTFLEIDKFDIVSIGATIGYSKSQETTITTLLDMVKHNGYFINIEMNENLIGKLVSKKYCYPILPLSKMENIIKSCGFNVTSVPISTFPANLTRVCYIARKI